MNNLTLSDQSGGDSFMSGNTVYFHGSTAGSFTITNGLTDSASGPASSAYPNLGGTSTGWTHTASTERLALCVEHLQLDGRRHSSPTEMVTGTDNVGNTITTSSPS